MLRSGQGSTGRTLLGVDASNLVAVLNHLEDAGLIVRRRDPTLTVIGGGGEDG